MKKLFAILLAVITVFLTACTGTVSAPVNTPAPTAAATPRPTPGIGELNGVTVGFIADSMSASVAELAGSLLWDMGADVLYEGDMSAATLVIALKATADAREVSGTRIIVPVGNAARGDCISAARFIYNAYASAADMKKLGFMFEDGEVSEAPAVTLSVGNPLNPADAAALFDPDKCAAMAEGIAAGVVRHVQQLETKAVTPADGGYGEVTARWPIAIYSSPDCAEVVTTASNGQRLRLSDAIGALTEVELIATGETGYALTDYIGAADAPTLTDYAPDYVNTELQVRVDGSLSVRYEGFTGSDKAEYRMRNGDRVTLLGFSGPYAQVLYNDGEEGYVSAGYLVSRGEQPWEKDISTVTIDEEYTHAQLLEDAAALKARFPELIALSSIGSSVNGRELTLMTVGNPEAEHKIFIQAAIHAREYSTAMLVMAEAEWLCANEPELLKNVCYHIVPMANPDGAEIVQSAEAAELVRSIYEADIAAGYTDDPFEEYVRRWKANGAGVDLNRNFDSFFGEGASLRAEASYALFAGAEPVDQPESAAMLDYLLAREWDLVLHYHSYGSILYWNFRTSPANGASWDAANVIKAVTGYQLRDDTGVDGGGFKDYLQLLDIPSVTIEVGSRESPLPLDDFTTTWYRNRDLLTELGKYVTNK